MKLCIEHLSKKYGELQVLQDLSLTLEQNACYCLMSPSGSGKTTLLRILMGLETADSGRIFTQGGPEWPLGISAVFQEDRLCPSFSPMENVQMALKEKWKEEKLAQAMTCLLPKECLTRPVSTLSGGMKRRTAILRAVLPFGKVTLLQGDPGDGKSKLMLSIAALLSKGEPLPFTDEEKTEPMTIIYQTTEDDADDTVVPRFNSAGGNGENLIFIKEDEKSLSFGDNRIAEAIEKYHAKLLILDPMSSYIGEGCSMNNANETRAEFNHLIAVAKDTGCAIVIIAHMNKMKDTNPLYRTNGSIDIAGAARSILAITRTPNKEASAERCMVQVKSNLAPTGSAILFEVAEKGVDFISEMEMTAEQAFQSLAPKMGRPNDKEIKAKEFLVEMLKDGEMLSTDCEEKLEAAGFKKSTVKKAKKKAGVISEKKGFLWYWSLPAGEIPKE